MSHSENHLKTVAILGGTGFAGAELYRMLSRHPYFEVAFVSSESRAGFPVEKYYRPFVHQKSGRSLRFSKIENLGGPYDLVFSCLPTGILPRYIHNVAEQADYVFNLSGDYRLSDHDLLQKHYPETVHHSFGGKSHYFIPEFSEIEADAKVVNLPGCMAVTTIYTLYPLLAHDLIENRIVADAKTGSSGGGKASSEPHAVRAGNFRPHKVHGHRHKPEVEMVFHDFFDYVIDLQFSTYSLDLPRGIMVTTYSVLKENFAEIDVKKAFHSCYSTKPFVHNLRSGYMANSFPMIKSVVGTNHVEVGAYVDGKNCVSIASLDNLIKGASGQAIQAANLYMGLPGETGLRFESEGVWP